MAYLQDLKVKKVSFVKRGANKRQFFLAKSTDSVDLDEDFSTSITNKTQGGRKMRVEVKTKLGEILKSERGVDKIIAAIKEDAVLKATEEELTEVREFVELIPPLPEVKKEEPKLDEAALIKARADAQKYEEEKKALEARLAKIEEDSHKKELADFLAKDCPYLNVPATDAVAQIMKAEKVDAGTAEMLKQSFISTSDAIRVSQLTKELGRSGEEGLDPIGGNVVAEVVKKTQELKKTDANTKTSEIIRTAIQSLGPVRYENYRRDFNRRARTY